MIVNYKLWLPSAPNRMPSGLIGKSLLERENKTWYTGCYEDLKMVSTVAAIRNTLRHLSRGHWGLQQWSFPHFTSRYRVLGEIIEAECQTTGLNATGKIRGGFVKLRGSFAASPFAKKSADPVRCVLENGSSMEAATMSDSREVLAFDGRLVYCLSMLEYG